MANLSIHFYRKEKLKKSSLSYEDSFPNNGNVSCFFFVIMVIIYYNWPSRRSKS